MSNYQWEDKCWGRTKQLWITAGPPMTKHILEMKANTFCSFHYHRNRANVFHVLSGHVRLILLNGLTLSPVDLKENLVFIVPARVCHQFQVVEDSTMVEDYFCESGAVPNPDDIERLWPGGVTSEKLMSISPRLLLPNGQLWVPSAPGALLELPNAV